MIRMRKLPLGSKLPRGLEVAMMIGMVEKMNNKWGSISHLTHFLRVSTAWLKTMRPSVVLLSSLIATGVDAKSRASVRALVRPKNTLLPAPPAFCSIPRGGQYSYDRSGGYPEDDEPYSSSSSRRNNNEDYYGDDGMYQDDRDYNDRGMVGASGCCFAC